MDTLTANDVLDAKGLSCPMPIVKTKKRMTELNAGEVLEVQATDKGSKADIRAWAERAGHQYLGTLEEGEILKHYLRKSSDAEERERKYPHVISNEDLSKQLDSGKKMTVLDVREEAEYAFSHIPEAISIPLGELEKRAGELNKEDRIYVICRSGTRSDLAAQRLKEKGFDNVFNVFPGMSDWQGETTGLNKGGQQSCQ